MTDGGWTTDGRYQEDYWSHGVQDVPLGVWGTSSRSSREVEGRDPRGGVGDRGWKGGEGRDGPRGRGRDEYV